MIKEVVMYTVICDNCGKDALEGDEYSCWNEPFAGTEIADKKGWYTDNSENIAYCSECWEYDDDDNLVVRKKPESDE